MCMEPFAEEDKCTRLPCTHHTDCLALAQDKQVLPYRQEEDRRLLVCSLVVLALPFYSALIVLSCTD